MKNPLPRETYRKRRTEKKTDVRGAFFRDQTAIIHSMPFRRLKHKTQVFFAPENDHVCTRIEHVMHVATIAKSICKGLNKKGWKLNVEMAFAIGLGHDLGHAPFGHDGETILNQRLGGGNAFVHEVNSYRIVEFLANSGHGLNLTYGVKDGIITHNGEKFEQHLKPYTQEKNLDKITDRSHLPSSYEGCIVRFADKIAYLGRDIEDAITAGFVKRSQIPEKARKTIGDENSQIINTLALDIINNSYQSDKIGFSDQIHHAVVLLKEFNYKKIYHNPKRISYKPFAQNIIHQLFDHLLNIFETNAYHYPKYTESRIPLDEEFGNYARKMQHFYQKSGDSPEQIVTDYISGMTDLFALDSIKQITIPPSIFVKNPLAG